MCGITGFIDFAKHSDPADLAKMLQALKKRGPDDEGQFFTPSPFAHIGLAHSRLSILDLSSAGHQPYQFQHLHLVYNGEVYNFKEIQKQLEQKGYTFVSHSDTEVIIKAFHCWGTSAVERFRGMFAFCLYDEKDHKLYLFRDRAGVKPLYFYHKSNLLIFGSTLAPVMRHPRFEKSLNPMGLSQYMQFGYITTPYSIFQNTFKLAPGNYAVLDLKSQKLTQHTYWDIDKISIQPVSNITEAEATKTLEVLLKESFNLRMVADVPVGCFLSGGIDSSLVAAVLQKNLSKQIHTFTIGFAELEHNEAHHAKTISSYIGSNHTEYYCTKQDALDIIPLLPEVYDEPFADSSAIPTFLVSKLARQQIKVALSGDGGDELFGGYLVYQKFLPLFKKLLSLPKKQLFAKIGDYLPNHIGHLSNKRYLKLKSLLGIENISLLFRTASSVYTPYEVKKFLGYHLTPDTNLVPFCQDFASTMMLTDFKNYLAEDILVKVDRATMFAGLEGREPLLDHKIIEYAASLPIAYKKQKNILKNILSQYIPRELFERKKQGFGMPINLWLQKDLKHFIDYYLDETRIKQQGLFNPSYVQHLKKKLFANKIHDQQLWILLMFQMWQEKNL